MVLRKVCFFLILLFFFIFFVEVIFAAFYYIKNGNRYLRPWEMITVNEFLAQDMDSHCGWHGIQTLHPFLGHYSIMPEQCQHSQFDVNWQGFFGKPIPLVRDKEYFDILLIGGSVAARLGQTIKGGPNFLEEALNERYLPPYGKKFRVFNGANGGWRQPQQVIMVLLYGNGVDGVISLEGFNEHWSFATNQRIGTPNNVYKNLSERSVRATNLLYTDILSHLNAFMYNHFVTRNSYFVYSLFDIIKLVLKNQLNQNDDEIVKRVEESFEFHHNKKHVNQYNFDQYKNFLLSISTMTKELGIEHAIFFQPVPLIGKDLTNQEKRVTGKWQYANLYQNMVNEMLSLKAKELNIFDLLYLFENETGTIYADMVHPIIDHDTGDGKGYRILAESMSSDIAIAWLLVDK